MSKALCGALLACLAVGLTSSPARAISLDLTPAASSLGLGSAATVALTISGLGDATAPSLATFDVDVTFDPTILAFASATYGDPALGDQLDASGLGSLFTTTLGSDFVNLFELSLDPAADLDAFQAGAFTLATLTFSTIGPGTSPLVLSVNALGDGDGDALIADAVGAGSVTATAPPTAAPEPPSVLLLAAGAAALAGVSAWKRHGSAR